MKLEKRLKILKKRFLITIKTRKTIIKRECYKRKRSFDSYLIILPEKPEKLTLKSDDSVEKALLKEKMDLLRDYKATEEEYKKTTRLKHLCNISEFIVKALDPKGPVIKEFIETFVDCLEDACNERAAMLKPGFELRLIPEDGLKVLFRMGTYKEFLPYAKSICR